MAKTGKPVALVDPSPRRLELIFRAEELEELRALVQLDDEADQSPPAEAIEAILPQASFVIGQTDLPRERLERAPRLQAIFNVEGNFLPNVDYEECFRRGIHVLSVAPVFNQPVAELGLGLCLDLARGITSAHVDFTRGQERYGLAGNGDARLLRGQHVGIVGYGGLGRAVHKLLEPFQCVIRVHDPWLPDRLVSACGCQPCGLEELLSSSNVVFVTAAATTENQGLLSSAHFRRMPRGALFILLSRASVVNFPDMLAAAAGGHIRVATDVFPEEPLPAGHPARSTPNLLLSAHRAGGIDQAFKEMGTLILSDVKQLLRGLPPHSCLRAERETVGRARSRPVKKT